MTLRIECPGCQRAFEVDKELEGKTVECGSCETRFRVAPDVIVANRERFYPDEAKKDADLSRFGRAPASSAPVKFQTMAYDQGPTQNHLGPIPPVRLFATGIGLFILASAAAIFYFGSQASSDLLRDVERVDRYILGGFFSLVGCGLLCWGMVRKRVLGWLIGLLAVAGVMAMAHLMPIHRAVNSKTPVLTGERVDRSVLPQEEPTPDFFPGITSEELTAEEVMRRTRWEAAVFPLIGQGDEAHVAAVWVRSMEEFHGKQIQSYLAQEFGLSEIPYFRELGRDGGIFAMSGLPFDLEEVEAVVERFGEVEQVIPELRLVQMQANPAVLGEVSNRLTAKLNDPNDGAFYPLNHAELIALDRSRVKNAIRRLAIAKPIRMRKDITVRLVGLLSEEFDDSTYEELAEAIEVWSEEGDGADQVVANLGVRIRAQGRQIPEGMLRFLAQRKTPSAASLLVGVWSQDPTGNQRFIEKFGSGAAPLLSSFLTDPQPAVNRSAAWLLGRIGGSAELAALQEVMAESSDEELKSVIKDSINLLQK